MADDPDITSVRQELSTAPMDHPGVELAVLLRVGGTWRRRGTPMGAVTEVVVTSTAGAVVRRVVALCEVVGLPRPEVAMRAAGGLRRHTEWGATLVAASLVDLGVVTASGGPVAGLPTVPEAAVGAALRGALLAAGSVSSPRREAHLELRLPSTPATLDLADLLTARGLAAHVDEGRDRVVVKSQAGLHEVLDLAGAHDAAAAHARHRERRQLRNRATRLANADAANVTRSVDAARTQVRALQGLVDAVGWDVLPDDLRAVGLARLVNPSASLAELGELVDPPLGKSTVHRRLGRLQELAARHAATGSLAEP